MYRLCGWLVLGVLLLSVPACQEEVNPNFQEEADNPELLIRSVKALTDVIVHDIFSPPVASRIYAYSSIAAYEAAAQGNPEYQSLAGQVTDLSPVPKPEAGQTYCFPLAAVQAHLTVGRALIFSEDKLTELKDELLAEFKAVQMPSDVYERSLAYGEAVAKHILEWSTKDMYKQTRTYAKYSISDDPSRWQPTPPAYMDGIEPHWSVIRPLVLDSAQQFKPVSPTAYDPDPNGQFMKETREVYEALQAEDKEERTAIAKFWDCNPYVSHTTGHVMFATKKITPGGHWMGIAGLAARQSGADFVGTAATYAMTSMALFDGFISCWDEKYRSNLVRPETVINRHIDETWQPLLQTPPFPEYTSGHSVISRAAATVLTSIYGDDFEFLDTTEEDYGLPARQFSSFFQASEEAALSRLYGGIHYRPAIVNGVQQGEKIGRWVVDQVQLKSRLTQK